MQIFQSEVEIHQCQEKKLSATVGSSVNLIDSAEGSQKRKISIACSDVGNGSMAPMVS